ncbi:MAG: hypothetical protein SP1CHLAM54_13820 [Chlamydiia bacterium]|nr:hypothetical protein [Chlamydiia bacterium]MCH9616275.1 hypothetical protein [Chlamydiia bacterium]MCH9629739.1 hypothetical protein [Chlamydiia bacterium]
MEPLVPAKVKTQEFTFKAVLLGVLLSLVFAVGNAYLGLRVGMTISASIPAAVLSMTILRIISRKVTALENNIVQTIAAVGEGLAAGVIFTIPALFLLGARPTILHISLLAFLGGVLGILFMIPMRRYLIVKEHGVLPFPEGTACAEIIKSRESDKGGAKVALWGIIVGAGIKLCSGALYLWKETVSFTIKLYEGAVFSMDCTPALMGVGFIIGPRIAAVMLAGGAIGWWVIIPIIQMFGQGAVTIYPSHIDIASMNSVDIWSNYVRYIGAGAVAIGGIINLVRLVPIIRRTFVDAFAEIFHKQNIELERTDRDISLKYLVLGSIAILLFIWLYPGFQLNLVTILILTILAFFFSAVTSITVGLVGSSSNPVSGMTITTLLITCIIFLLLGWTERLYLIAAITMGCIASITICLASTTSQDLKTGFLLGATPWKQQVAEMIGLVLPCLAIGGTLYLLDKAYGFGTTQLPAPQATLMTVIAKGVMQGNLPVTLVMIGVVLGLIIRMIGLPVLAFAIGLYLPLALSTAVMIGGLVNLIVRRRPGAVDRGILSASGLVAGDACTGVIVAFLTIAGFIPSSASSSFPQYASLIIFALLGAYLAFTSLGNRYPKNHI